MDYYGLGVALAVFGSMLIGLQVGIKYSQATLVFGFIAAVCAPIVIHKIQSIGGSVSMLVALAYYASFPQKNCSNSTGSCMKYP